VGHNDTNRLLRSHNLYLNRYPALRAVVYSNRASTLTNTCLAKALLYSNQGLLWSVEEARRLYVHDVVVEIGVRIDVMIAAKSFVVSSVDFVKMMDNLHSNVGARVQPRQ
jgi:hypothetical protein